MPKRIFTTKQKLTKSIYDKKRYEENKEHVKLRTKSYRLANKEKINENTKIYNKIRRKTNPIYKISSLIRTAIGEAFRTNGFTKQSKTYKILGCSYQYFKTYIEGQFKPWMNWNNHGLYNGELDYGWDIDHIIPLNTATCEADIIRLNHYTNLQPLCGYINRRIKRGISIILEA